MAQVLDDELVLKIRKLYKHCELNTHAEQTTIVNLSMSSYPLCYKHTSDVNLRDITAFQGLFNSKISVDLSAQYDYKRMKHECMQKLADMYDWRPIAKQMPDLSDEGLDDITTKVLQRFHEVQEFVYKLYDSFSQTLKRVLNDCTSENYLMILGSQISMALQIEFLKMHKSSLVNDCTVIVRMLTNKKQDIRKYQKLSEFYATKHNIREELIKKINFEGESKQLLKLFIRIISICVNNLVKKTYVTIAWREEYLKILTFTLIIAHKLQLKIDKKINCKKIARIINQTPVISIIGDFCINAHDVISNLEGLEVNKHLVYDFTSRFCVGWIQTRYHAFLNSFLKLFPMFSTEDDFESVKNKLQLLNDVYIEIWDYFCFRQHRRTVGDNDPINENDLYYFFKCILMFSELKFQLYNNKKMMEIMSFHITKHFKYCADHFLLPLNSSKKLKDWKHDFDHLEEISKIRIEDVSSIAPSITHLTVIQTTCQMYFATKQADKKFAKLFNKKFGNELNSWIRYLMMPNELEHSYKLNDFYETLIANGFIVPTEYTSTKNIIFSFVNSLTSNGFLFGRDAFFLLKILDDSSAALLSKHKSLHLVHESVVSTKFCFTKILNEVSEQLFQYLRSQSAMHVITNRYMKQLSKFIRTEFPEKKQFFDALGFPVFYINGEVYNIRLVVRQRLTELFSDSLNFAIAYCLNQKISMIGLLSNVLEAHFILHKLLCSYVPMNDFETFLLENNVNENIFSYICTELTDKMFNRCQYNLSTGRFVYCGTQLQDDVDETDSANSTMFGSEELDAQLLNLVKQQENFIGSFHFEVILSLLNIANLEKLFDTLCEFCINEITELCEQYIFPLWEQLNIKNLERPKAIYTAEIFTEKLFAMYSRIMKQEYKDKLYEEIFPKFSVVGNCLAFVIGLTNSMKTSSSLLHNNISGMKKLSKFEEFPSTVSELILRPLFAQNEFFNCQIQQFISRLRSFLLSKDKIGAQITIKESINDKIEFYRVWGVYHFLFCHIEDTQIPFEELSGDGVYFGACSILYLLRQNRRYQFFDVCAIIENMFESDKRNPKLKVTERMKTFVRRIQIYSQLSDSVFSILSNTFQHPKEIHESFMPPTFESYLSSLEDF